MNDYTSGYQRGYQWGRTAEAIIQDEPLWAYTALLDVVAKMNEFMDANHVTTELEAIQDAIISAQEDWETRRSEQA